MKSRKRTPSDFIFEGELGHGSYSTVIKAIDKRTKKVYAIKVCSKAHIIRERKVKYVTIEKNTLNLLARANHPGIVKLYYTFHDADNLYFVLDYAPGGELLTLLHKVGRFSEAWSRHFMVQLVDTVEYMHSQGVIHRDLKPENILLDREGRLMVTDFGAASAPNAAVTTSGNSVSNGNIQKTTNCVDGTIVGTEINNDKDGQIQSENDSESGTSSFVGTAEYVSPELLLHNRCSFSSDIWALGCMIYQFLEGHPPFRGKNELQTYEKIVELDYSWRRGSNPNKVNSQIIDLVGKILVIDDKERINLENIKLHPWFSGVHWNDKSAIWKGIWPIQQQQQQQQQQSGQNERKDTPFTSSRTLPSGYGKYVSNGNNTGNNINDSAAITNKNMISNRQLHVIETPIKNITIAKQKRKKPTKISNTTSSIVEWRRKLGISTGTATGTNTVSPSVTSAATTTTAAATGGGGGSTAAVLTNLIRSEKVYAKPHGQRHDHGALSHRSGLTHGSNRAPNVSGSGRGVPPVMPIFFSSKSQMKRSVSTNSVSIKQIPDGSHSTRSSKEAFPTSLPLNDMANRRQTSSHSRVVTNTANYGGTTNLNNSQNGKVVINKERKLSAPTIPTESLLLPPSTTGTSRNPHNNGNSTSNDSSLGSDSDHNTSSAGRTLSGSNSGDRHILKRDFVYIYSIPYREDGEAMSLRSYNRIDNDLITELVSKYESVLKTTGAEPKLMTLHDSGLLFYSDSLDSKVTNIVNIGDSDLSMYDFEFDQSTRKGFLILEKYKHMIWFISLPSYTVVSRQATIQSGTLSPHIVIKNVFENWVDCFFRTRKLLEEREEENLLNAMGNISLDSDLDYNNINAKSSNRSSPRTLSGSQNIIHHTSTSFNSVSGAKLAMRTISDASRTSRGNVDTSAVTATATTNKQKKAIKEPPQHILPPTVRTASHSSPSVLQRRITHSAPVTTPRHVQQSGYDLNSQLGLSKPSAIRPTIKSRSNSGSNTSRTGASTPDDGIRSHRGRSMALSTAATTATTTGTSTPLTDNRRFDVYDSPSPGALGGTSRVTVSTSVSPRIMVSPRFRNSPATTHIKKYTAPSNMLISSSRYEVIHALDPQIKTDSNPQGIASSGASAAFRNLQQQQRRHRNGTKVARKK